MEINQTSVAFAGTAAVAPQQQNETQKAVQEERDEVQRSTGKTSAVIPADAANVRSDAPDDAPEDETRRVAAESDSPSDSRSEGEQSRGDRVDVTV